VVCAAGAIGLYLWASTAGARADSTLDRLFTDYAAGDYGVVARTLRGPEDFRTLRLEKPQALDDWLGAWDQRKAIFLIDLARAANVAAPPRTWPILLSGRRYVTEHALSSIASDEFERIWHYTALGLLQRHAFADYEERYLDALKARSLSSTPDRITLARGIAQEQRCWNDRPDLDRAGADADAVARAAGQDVASHWGISRSTLAEAHKQQEACWTEALTRYRAAFSSDDAGAEARVRGAWILLQLGQPRDAFEMIDGALPEDDPELAYWAGLFRGRIADSLGRYPEAEHAYRAALEASPNAQSAGIGLALTLFKMNRDADADAVAFKVRSRPTSAADPWWTYINGDFRFVERWTARLRGMR
jgi:tetratricopeptide (TPR) repeat protein